MKRLRRQIGVTLPELMITISMLAIMMSLSAPNYSNFINKRKMAGAADQISTFFENAKMEAVTRNDFVTITYNESDHGSNWCFGVKAGQHQKCDCLAVAPTTANACRIDPAGPTVILSNTSFPGLANLLTTTELDDNDHLDFNPVRGSLSHHEKVTMQISHSSENFRVNISVTPTGRVVKCTPSGYQSVGYPTCI